MEQNGQGSVFLLQLRSFWPAFIDEDSSENAKLHDNNQKIAKKCENTKKWVKYRLDSSLSETDSTLKRKRSGHEA